MSCIKAIFTLCGGTAPKSDYSVDNSTGALSEVLSKIIPMYDEEPTIKWDATDIKMSIKRYFYKLDRFDAQDAYTEIEFMRSIHREWSFNPLMRRCAPEAMAIIDDFLKWYDATPIPEHSINDFTVRRLIR